jgi:hypothetical protein
MRGSHRKCRFCNKHISERIEKYLSLLKDLSHAESKRRDQILRDADICFIKLLRECAINVLKGNIPLEKTQTKKLSRHAQTLVKFATNKPTNYDRQKQLLMKNGGFLPIILPALITALGGIAGNVISKLVT